MNILSAPTSLGNRPYEDDGTARHTDRGPARLREQNLACRLAANDLGDIPAAAYRDFKRPRGGIRNEDLVLEHVRAVARAIADADDTFTLVLGGDCSVLLGSLLGLRAKRDELGLVFIDGHSDFATERQSTTGGVAGMDLALAVGRGESLLARLRDDGPLVAEEHVVAVGVREGDFEGTKIRTATNASDVLEKLGDRDFFIHVDVDVLDPEFMPFVDSPVDGGLAPDALVALLRPLARHPRAVGMEVTIYDPRHDPNGRGAALLADVIEAALTPSSP